VQLAALAAGEAAQHLERDVGCCPKPSAERSFGSLHAHRRRDHRPQVIQFIFDSPDGRESAEEDGDEDGAGPE
jgi:hypothetical protein